MVNNKSLPNILIILSMVGIGITSWFGMDTRLSVLEGFPETHRATHDNFNEMQKAMFMEVTKQIDLLRGDLVRNNINSLAEIRSNRDIIIQELRK